MDTTLMALLQTIPTNGISFRVGLTCSLLAAGAYEGVILAPCSWRSPASLRIFARLNNTASAEWLDRADAQQLDSIQTPSLLQLTGTPEAEDSVPSALLPHVHAILDRIEVGEHAQVLKNFVASLLSRLTQNSG
jgi:hypothetical protein